MQIAMRYAMKCIAQCDKKCSATRPEFVRTNRKNRHGSKATAPMTPLFPAYFIRSGPPNKKSICPKETVTKRHIKGQHAAQRHPFLLRKQEETGCGVAY